MTPLLRDSIENRIYFEEVNPTHANLFGGNVIKYLYLFKETRAENRIYFVEVNPTFTSDSVKQEPKNGHENIH